jgi:hypothetical protein
MRVLRHGIAMVILGAGLSACFLGYDSRWGETKRAQQRAAKASAPASITPSDDRSSRRSDADQRTYRIRARTTARFLAQTVDAPKQIADLLEDANRVLEPTLALHVELQRIQPWSADADEDVESALRQLQADDPGQDVDLVVGMIGALPRQTESLHELGMAPMLGKQLVVRAASRLGEQDHLDDAFNELSADERARMVRQRKRHRALAVFLHELGHTLGALHEQDPRSLMNPRYDTHMAGYGAGAVALMRLALDEADRAAVVHAQLELLRGAKQVAWIPAERDQEIANLESMLARAEKSKVPMASPPSGPAAPSASAPALPEVPSAIQGGDRDAFVHAQEMLRAGDVRGAYEAAKPLFVSYPNVYAVQDLRCQLALLRWLDKDGVAAECAPMKRLTPPGDAGADAAH